MVRAQFHDGLSSLAKRQVTWRVVEKLADVDESSRMLVKEVFGL